MADPPYRVVIDPNVYISAAITTSGATARILDMIDAGTIVPVVSPRVLVELTEVLRRERFRRYLDLATAMRFITELERLAELYDDPDDVEALSPDADDDYLIALARSGQVDALVSGDHDLTALDIAGLRVLTPRQLLDTLADHA